MNKFFLIGFLIFAALGCAKTQEQQPEDSSGKSFKLSIKVDDNAGNFTAIQSVSSNKSILATGNSLASYVNNIYYRIYKADGKLLSSLKQVSTAADFGGLTQELPVGEYKIFIAASPGDILMIDNGDLTRDRFGFPGGWVDVFTSLSSVSVTNADVSQTIKLERATAMLNLTITDAIPANTAKIIISVQPESSYKYVSGAPEISIIGTSYNTSIFSGDIGVRNKTLSAIIGNTGNAVNINVKAYNPANVVTAEKNIPNITLVKNKKTQVSVQLFTP